MYHVQHLAMAERGSLFDEAEHFYGGSDSLRHRYLWPLKCIGRLDASDIVDVVGGFFFFFFPSFLW